MKELERVTRPGGLTHLENEPVGRAACSYQFRGNRPDRFTPFEAELEKLGLTRIVSSPFPGSRDEELFGMIENDRIALSIYENAFHKQSERLEWTLEIDSLLGPVEQQLNTMSSAEDIGNLLLSLVSQAAPAYGERDAGCGFTIPSPDEIWPIAYRIAEARESKRDQAVLWGAALRATIRKHHGSGTSELFRRDLREVDGVMLDDGEMRRLGLDLANVMPAVRDGTFGADWYVMTEDNGYDTLANLHSDCLFPLDLGNGILIMRIYSIAQERPYYFSVKIDGEIRYTHCVSVSESHLAKIYIKSGQKVSIFHHEKDGIPREARLHTRFIPKFVQA